MMIAIVLAPCKLQMCRSYVKIYCLCLEQRGEDEQRSERERVREGGRGSDCCHCLSVLGLAISFTLGAGGLLFFALSSTGFGLLARRHKTHTRNGSEQGQGGSCCSDHIIRVAAAAVAGSSFLYFSARLKEVLWQVIFISSRFAAAAAVACGQSQQRWLCCPPLCLPSTACRLFYRHSFFAAVLCIYKDTRAFLQPQSQPQHDL